MLLSIRRPLIFILALLLTGCGGDTPSESAPDRNGSSTAAITIVTTTGMVRDVVAHVAGDHAGVVSLMSSGIDPHLYKPTRSDVKRIIDSDLVFYSGLLLEGKMTETFDRAESSGKPVHALTERLEPSSLLDPEGFAGHHDPHVWMDPSMWAQAVDVARDVLAEHDPAHADVYAENAESYKQALLELDAYCERILTSVPEHQRVLVTAHDAFGYFGRRFGFQVVGIQGISTESEAGVRDIERLVDLIVEREISAVFVESTVSERNINALIAGAQARGHTVTIGGELFSDAMGDEGTYEGTYIGMIDHNATTIARSLGGQAPERGYQGKLSD